jgi:hypothetical protein
MKNLMAVVALLCGVAGADAATPIRDERPVLLMHDIIINSPPETPFGTAMGAFRAWPELWCILDNGPRLALSDPPVLTQMGEPDVKVDPEAIMKAAITYNYKGELRTQIVVIYDGKIFWDKDEGCDLSSD